MFTLVGFGFLESSGIVNRYMGILKIVFKLKE